MSIKKVLCISDVHLDSELPIHSSYKLVKKFAMDFEPDETIIMGDFLDFGYISSFTKPIEAEGRRIAKDFAMAHKELNFWKHISSDKVTYLEGNHEHRLHSYISKHPEIEGVVTLNSVLDPLDIEYVPINVEYQMYNSDMYAAHGAFHNKYFTQKTFEYYGRNIVVGHMHTIQATSRVMRGESEYIAQSIGCLCDKNPDYLMNRPSQFINGFGVCYVDTKSKQYTFLNIPIINSKFMFEGKLWK